MEKRGEISLYRARLDKSLASPELKDHEALKSLVRDQMLQSRLDESEDCSENLLEKRTAEVSNFLGMLRSASSSGKDPSKANVPSSGEWKVKDSNKEYRVMYRPGPKGSPFQSLLVEGYVDGPVDACLCIGWESALYKKCVKKLVKKSPWWPQVIIPPFKIAACRCLKRVRIGEQISLVRMKVWPLQAREAIIHYVLFEYFKEGIIIVLMNTVPEMETINVNTHGFTKDGIPAAQDVVRADLVGGFVLQKVNSTRSYFRTIAAADLKLDFIPTSLVNYISRQLIGTGFKLYQKAVTALYKDDEEYVQALADPFYARMRKAIYATNGQHQIMEGKEPFADTSLPGHDHSIDGMESNGCEIGQPVNEDNIDESTEWKIDELEEFSHAADKGMGPPSALTIKNLEKGSVKKALETLEKAKYLRLMI